MSPVQQFPLLVRRERLASEACRIGTGPGRQRGGNFPTGLEAPINQPARLQGVERGLIFSEVVRLASHGAIPVQSEPFKIGENGGFVLRTASGLVNVFNPQQHLSIMGAGSVPDMESRERVTEMQMPGGGRCEPRDKFPGSHATP